MGAQEKSSTGIGSFFAGLGARAAATGTEVPEELVQRISDSLLSSSDVNRVIRLHAVQLSDGEVLVGAKIDVAPDLTMRQVSVIVNMAERRIHEAVPEVSSLFIAPDVWIDPDAAQPTTSAIVLLSGN